MMTKKILKILLMVMVGTLLSANCAYAGERLAVIVEKANIRSGPGQNHDVIWMVEKYHPLIIIKKSKGWYKFRDFEGDEGWVYKNLLGSVNSVIVKKDNCNVRSGPGTKNKVLFTVDKGIPFKVLETKSGWYHVQHADGDKGWIFKKLVW